MSVIQNIADSIVAEAKFRIARKEPYQNLASAIYAVKLEVVYHLVSEMEKANIDERREE